MCATTADVAVKDRTEPPCTPFEYDVLAHASSNGRYVTGDRRVIELAERGWLRDYGPQALAAGAHYLTVTPKGREIINTYRATLPKPTMKRRRTTEVFAEWRRFTDAGYRMPFGEFVKSRAK